MRSLEEILENNMPVPEDPPPTDDSGVKEIISTDTTGQVNPHLETRADGFVYNKLTGVRVSWE